MNAHTTLAQQIADEAGAPQNVDMIERQLLRKSFEANRAAIKAALPVRSLAYDRVRLSAVSLSHEEQIALVSHIVDHLDGVDDDLRNAAVDAIGLLV